MNLVNLMSFIEISKITNQDLFERMLKLNKIEIKDHEIQCIESMMSLFEDTRKIEIFDSFLLGYKIPQIGKEFDLLRISVETALNIELKSSFDEKKIVDQILRNMHYLNALNRNLRIFTYVQSEKSFFKLNKSSMKLEKCLLHEIEEVLHSQSRDYENPSVVLIPSNFLVSPFNSTEEFLNENYFLTHQQEEIESVILNHPTHTYGISGQTGTGKTLLLYDLASKFMRKDNKTVIIHGGMLNPGQNILNSAGFHIVGIKSTYDIIENIEKYDAVFIDEGQRLSSHQLTELLDKKKLYSNTLVISYDQMQVLSKNEERENVSKIIEHNVIKENIFILSKKIRTNKELADFIIGIINRKKSVSVDRERVDFTFFSSFEQAKQFVLILQNDGWQAINPSSSLYDREIHDDYQVPNAPSTHQVIGQEFEKVVVIIPPSYYYNEDGQLVFMSKSYYYAEKMFFQAISRTKNRIHFVIVNNLAVLDRVSEIVY